MDITLYGATDTNAWRVQWMLNELDVSYEHIDFDIHGDDAKDNPIFEKIVQLNPHGTVPVLKCGEDIVWDSLAINLYLADSFGKFRTGAGVIPAMQWSLWAAGLEDQIRTAQLHHSSLPEAKRDPEVATQARRGLTEPLLKLNVCLERSPYIYGSTFTVADLNVVCVLAHLDGGGFDEHLWPQLERWMGECGSRPALARVFE